jgi:SAM-dependent methyltransferase
MQLAPTPPGDMYLPPEKASLAQQRFPIDLNLCRDCGYAGLLDIVDPAAIYPDYIYTTATSPGLVAHFGQYAERAAAVLSLQKQSLVVDIGSNDGALLSGFKRIGMRVAGVEPATKIAEQANAGGIPTVNRFFDGEAVARILRDHGPAQLVTANNVFANIDDAASVVEGVGKLLAPGGTFAVEFMYLGDLVKNRVFDYVYHEHLSYFSIDALRRFFARHGMTLAGADHVETKGGSVRVYVQRKEEARPLDTAMAKLLEAEAAQGLADPATYRALQSVADANGAKCRELLAKYRAEKRRIVGYGASITCTTLIYYFALEPYLDFLVDDNATKHGTLCPGTKLVVRPSSVLRDAPPDVIVVLAWRFAGMILERSPRPATGGAFLLPMPEVKVIAS